MSAVPAPDGGPDAGAVWHYGDPLGEQRAAAHSSVIIDRSHRPALQLTGNDRRTWLHTISSQHVSELPDGAVVENLSLDGQGRVEDHWIQTELDGVTVIDTESWRVEPLLTYLRKMVFWADVLIEPADLAVLSLLGPGIRDQAVLAALGIDALPAPATALPLAGGGFIRTMGSDEVDLLVPRDMAADWHAKLVTAGVRPAGVWAYEAHRVAALRPRLGVDTDERTIPHEVGWIGGPGEGAVHLDKGCYPATGDPVLAAGRAVGRLGTVVDHVDLGPIALALLKRGVPADIELTTGGDSQVAAAIDSDSLPATDRVGAGRLAVERLRGQPR
jgi:folate-binding Fe-S cluster repair protein YgfZ